MAHGDVRFAGVAEWVTRGIEVIGCAVQVNAMPSRPMPSAAVIQKQPPGCAGKRLRARSDVEACRYRDVERIEFPHQVAVPDDRDRPWVATVEQVVEFCKQIEFVRVELTH